MWNAISLRDIVVALAALFVFPLIWMGDPHRSRASPRSMLRRVASPPTLYRSNFSEARLHDFPFLHDALPNTAKITVPFTIGTVVSSCLLVTALASSTGPVEMSSSTWSSPP